MPEMLFAHKAGGCRSLKGLGKPTS